MHECFQGFTKYFVDDTRKFILKNLSQVFSLPGMTKPRGPLIFRRKTKEWPTRTIKKNWKIFLLKLSNFYEITLTLTETINSISEQLAIIFSTTL
jgi:hypothetical protein